MDIHSIKKLKYIFGDGRTTKSYPRRRFRILVSLIYGTAEAYTNSNLPRAVLSKDDMIALSQHVGDLAAGTGRGSIVLRINCKAHSMLPKVNDFK